MLRLLAALAWLLPLLASAQPLVRGVEAIGITVSDLERSAAFYEEVLGFERADGMEVTGTEHERLYGLFALRLKTLRMRLGEESVELMEFMTPRGRPIPADSRSNDRWFQHVAIIVSDMKRAYRHLHAHGVQHASPEPQRLPDWNPAAGGIEAFYFRDPDGNHLEVLRFPPGKGDPKWQTADGRLFLGIDHTAIVVADTAASLAWYRDLLGLYIAGESENWGPEQERLNAVFGAHLRITALRAAAGPGVELLEYLAPGDGRPMPADSRANDLWHWQIVMDAAPAAGDEAMRRGRTDTISPAPIGFAAGPVAAALLVRDPDGHPILLNERR